MGGKRFPPTVESLLSGLKKRKRLESLTSGVYGRIAVVETAFLPTQRQA